MTVLKEKMTLGEVMEMENLQELGRYFIGVDHPDMEKWKTYDFDQMESEFGVRKESILAGLNRLYEVETATKSCLHRIYRKEEIEEEPRKADVVLMDFPTDEGHGERPYILVLAGGAYVNVYSILEAFPSAAYFNWMGYHALVLNYRTGGTRVMPDSLDDLAQAVRYIKEHEEQLHVNGNNYIVTGFSAAGNLTAEWGNPMQGYQKYELPKPKALFLGYPVINIDLFQTALPEEEEKREKMIRENAWFLNTMLGENVSQEEIESYNVDTCADETYPPSYLVCCKDDPTVPYIHSVHLEKKLKKLNIPVEIEIGNRGGHGFGTGYGTDCEDWITRAIIFEQKLQEQ